MNQACALDLVAKLGQNIYLIGNIIDVYIMNGCRTLHLIEFNLPAAEVFQNIHTAEQTFIREGGLADNWSFLFDQAVCDPDHLAKVAKRHFHKITEQAHGKIAYFVSRGKNCLVHDGIIKFLRHILPKPEHFWTLNGVAIT